MFQIELLEKIGKLIEEYEDDSCSVIGCAIDFVNSEKSFAWNGERFEFIPFIPFTER